MAPASFSAATFDIRGLSYLSHIDDNLCCPICHSPLIDPVSTQCRHTFCNECICGALEQSVTCPVDRKPLQPEDISMAPIMIANLVNDLVVLCPNSELGCATSCPRYLIGRHLEDNCQFVAVKCSGCKEAILRKDSESQCMHQEIECEFCFTKIRKSDSQEHILRCPSLTVICGDCESEIARSQVSEHELLCEQAAVSCNASAIGCMWSGIRLDAPDHERSCTFVYLQPVLQAQSDRITAVELENKALRKKIDILLPPRGSREDNDTSISLDDQTIQLLTEQEHQRSDLERLSAAQGEIDIKLGMLMMHMNEELRTREEIAMMGAAINNIRTQMHWMQRVAMRGQNQEYKRTSATTGGNSSNTNALPGPAGRSTSAADINPARDVVAGRLLSDSNSAGDRVKL